MRAMTHTTVRPPVDVGPPGRRLTAPASATPRVLAGFGLLIPLLYIAVTAIAGETPATDAPTAALTSYWGEDSSALGGFLMFGVAFAIGAFGAGLLGVLRAAGDDGPLPVLVGVGAAVAAAGLALDANVALILYDAAGEGDGATLDALHPLFEGLWMPYVAGFGLLLVGAGFSARRTGALPAPLAIAAMVLGCVAPFYVLGFATFLGGGVWCAITAVVLLRRGA